MSESVLVLRDANGFRVWSRGQGNTKGLMSMPSRFREVLDDKEIGNYYASSRRADERWSLTET